MKQTRQYIESLGLPSTDGYDLPTSAKRFPDGAQYRFEIPSVEGPRCLQTVIDEAKKHQLTIHRISQGSGILLQTDEEIREMLRIAKDHQMEVTHQKFLSRENTSPFASGSLFFTPRCGRRRPGLEQPTA